MSSLEINQESNNNANTLHNYKRMQSSIHLDSKPEPLILGCTFPKNFSYNLKVGICTFMTLFLFILYAYNQEWFFAYEGFKKYGLYLTLCQYWSLEEVKISRANIELFSSFPW